MSQYIDSEKWLEMELGKQVTRIGGKSIKFSSSVEVGYPDRIILMPGGKLVWVELKSKGERPRAVQEIRHEQLRRLGQQVYVIDRISQIDQLIRDLKPKQNDANLQ